MDGNPHVTAKSIRETLARHRALVLELYYRECQDLAGHLSQGGSRIGVSEELERRRSSTPATSRRPRARCPRAIGECRIARS